MRYELTDFEWAAIRSFLPNDATMRRTRTVYRLSNTANDYHQGWWDKPAS